MPTDPITLPTATTSIGALALDVVHPGLQKRHWRHVYEVSADYTVDDNSEFISVDATGSGDVTIELPDASDSAGQSVIIYCSATSGGNDVVLDCAATGDTVAGSGSISIVAAQKFVHLIADGGTNWLLYLDGR